MCGIAGFWRPGGLGLSSRATMTGMTDAILHRGPDDGGQWLDEGSGIALGQRRLAIIDLSIQGHQPMESADRRYVLVFNGEIYNFQDLRVRLDAEGKGGPWRGHSDTEVLLAAIVAWGVDPALRAVSGMFALALWDRHTRRLILARDRMGEKPLYCGWQGRGPDRTLLFGSDLAALRAHPTFNAEVDPDAVALLTRYLQVPEPRSIYRGIEKIMPGAWVEFAPDGSSEMHIYWDTLKAYAEAAGSGRFGGSPEEAVDAVERALGMAVERQSVADVPLGAFLSGGIDSSTIVALMQARSGRRVKTFSIGFTVDDYNEAPFAKRVAEHLGTEHEELIVGPEEALGVIPHLASIYTEPFADSSQIPTILVSRMARRHVTVALSGDAGDELFAGYNRYLHGHRTWPRIASIPRPLRRAAAGALQSFSPAILDRLVGGLTGGRMKGGGEKLHKAAGVLGAESLDELYHHLISINGRSDALMSRRSSTDGFEKRSLDALISLDPVDRMMALDAVHYLPGDILAKVDRAAMSTSLEARVPMLDPEVMRLAWSLPINYKIRDGQTKWPLRQILYRHVPRELVDRPKAGFGIPIGDWLRGPLRDWASALLEDPGTPLSDYYDVAAVRSLWAAHMSGQRNNQHRLWPVLMFQAWRQNARDAD
jgi:asparagine synthase (glutamine-hydrolysing)